MKRGVSQEVEGLGAGQRQGLEDMALGRGRREHAGVQGCRPKAGLARYKRRPASVLREFILHACRHSAINFRQRLPPAEWIGPPRHCMKQPTCACM